MHLKINAFFLIIGMGLGAYLFSAYSPKPAAQVVTVTKTDVKYKTRVVTLPDGTKTEVTESQSSSDSKPIVKKKYGVGLYHDKTIMAEARLGDMPLFLITETDFKQIRIGVKLEF